MLTLPLLGLLADAQLLEGLGEYAPEIVLTLALMERVVRLSKNNSRLELQVDVLNKDVTNVKARLDKKLVDCTARNAELTRENDKLIRENLRLAERLLKSHSKNK